MEAERVSDGIPITPRLEMVTSITSSVLEKLKVEKTECGWQAEYRADDAERGMAISIAIESLSLIITRLNSISSISDIVEKAPVLVVAIRAASSHLHPVLPRQSGDLNLASSTLGSIVMDSGIITGALFNLRQASCESALMLGRARRAAETKAKRDN